MGGTIPDNTFKYDGCIIAASGSLLLENARLDKRLHNRVIYTIRYDSCIIALIVAAKHMNQTHFDGRMQEWYQGNNNGIKVTTENPSEIQFDIL